MPAVAHALVDDGAVRTRYPLQPGRHPSTQVVEAHGMALPDSPNLGDVLINVAGGDTNHGTFEETTDEVWVSMIELNLLGVWSDAVGQRFLTCGAVTRIPRSSTSARSIRSALWAANPTRPRKQESTP
jgi:NAD(P)-dependent dehydrogenase (short-subunit alcohol dehydrogenase family)